MEYVICGFEPKKVFEYFEQISAIPRSSGDEQRVSDFLVSFAHLHSLEVYQDKYYNVMIKKPAAAGCEGAPAVALQGHMDMVCEKNGTTEHDFTSEPLKLLIRDGCLYADNTTLGADNGIAVAMMLAVLSDNTIKHPALECVFTVQEETGLTGAAEFDKSLIAAQYMINLDSEEEGVATVSCCGGIRTHLTKAISYIKLAGTVVKISIGGLAGGHSGMDIDNGRANANKLMGQALAEIRRRYSFNLVSINGGSKDNAIPRECIAVIAVNTSLENISDIINGVQTNISATLSPADCNFNITTETATACDMLDSSSSDNTLMFMNESPNGVLSRSDAAGGFLESSINFASIFTDANIVACVFSARSVSEPLKHDIVNRLEKIADTFGFTASHTGDYPGWNFDPQSRLRELVCKSYRELFCTELKLEAIHAGLECGLFKAKLPKLDIVAFGPTIHECHTPNEHLDLTCCNKVWLLLLSVLEKLCCE